MNRWWCNVPICLRYVHAQRPPAAGTRRAVGPCERRGLVPPAVTEAAASAVTGCQSAERHEYPATQVTQTHFGLHYFVQEQLGNYPFGILRSPNICSRSRMGNKSWFKITHHPIGFLEQNRPHVPFRSPTLQKIIRMAYLYSSNFAVLSNCRGCVKAMKPDQMWHKLSNPL